MPELRPLNVLIVEDEGLVAMDIEDVVRDMGHSVTGWAASAEDAIDTYGRTRPDLILLDVELLNGTSGLDVARHLQSLGGVHYVFLTANPNKLNDDFCGAIGVLPKPFTTSMLVASLQYLHEGVLDPPPSCQLPNGMRLGPDYLSTWN